MSREDNTEQRPEPIFKQLDAECPTTEIESLCMECGENVSLYRAPHNVGTCFYQHSLLREQLDYC